MIKQDEATKEYLFPKINLIKFLRESTDMDLKTCKEKVDGFLERNTLSGYDLETLDRMKELANRAAAVNSSYDFYTHIRDTFGDLANKIRFAAHRS